MDAERGRILDSLAAADPGEGVAAWWPDIGDGESPTVHTKLTVVDDRFAYLGSANLSNRSMGLDTEIGLGMDGSTSRPLAEAIAGLRRELLAEHLDCSPRPWPRPRRGSGSVIEAVKRSGPATEPFAIWRRRVIPWQTIGAHQEPLRSRTTGRARRPGGRAAVE